MILSANVFVAPLRALAIARAAAAARDRATRRRAIRRSRAALVEAAADPAITLATDRDVAGLEADRIDVYGRDETIAAVRSRARAGVVVRGHGAGLGVAFVAADTDADGFTGAQARRPSPGRSRPTWCPSTSEAASAPASALVEGPPSRAAAFAGALHDALAVLGSRVPRGALTPDERSEATRWRETLAFAGRVWAAPITPSRSRRPGRLSPFRPSVATCSSPPSPSAAAARELLAPFARFVVTVGGRDPAVARRARARRTPAGPRLGRMQRPPLDGPVDRRAP